MLRIPGTIHSLELYLFNTESVPVSALGGGVILVNKHTQIHPSGVIEGSGFKKANIYIIY